MDFAKGILMARKQGQLSQEQLAHLCSCTATHLSMIENNKGMPSHGLMERIAEACGMPVDILYYNCMDKRKLYDHGMFRDLVTPILEDIVNENNTNQIIKKEFYANR